jgi:hypothetical protein
LEEISIMKKKIFSIILAVALVMSMACVAAVSASAAVDSDGRYVPSTDDTYRYYFYMPSDWENQYTQSQKAGIYWWGNCTDACGAVDGSNPDSPAWPGYVAQFEATYAEGSVYYIDCPTDVGTIIWNNYVNGGTDKEADIYSLAYQTTNIGSEYYDEDESELYPEGTENFDNMIYVLDPTQTSENFEGKKTFVGEWYYYYGDGKYGVQPTEEEAAAADAVYDTAYYPPKTDDNSGSTDNNGNGSTNNGSTNNGGSQTTTTVPTASPDATSAKGTASTADTATKTNTSNGAVATGDSTFAFVTLFAVMAAAGVAVFARKKFN